jgi:ACR3 family arsenite efflux pump ArsB
MSRNGRLFLITHLYPLAMAVQMQWGDYTSAWNVLFQITPVFFVGLIIAEWIRTSSIKLGWHERQFLYYFGYCFVILHLYYVACLFASRNRILQHNHFMIWFAFITTIFYTYTHVARKIRFR